MLKFIPCYPSNQCISCDCYRMSQALSTKLVSIVIPVFNNEQSIPHLWDELLEQISNFPTLKFQVAFVDDGSSDKSTDKIFALKHHPQVELVLIELTKNYGQLSALKAGYANVRGDAIVTISADLQDPTSIVTSFVNHWLKGSKLVLGERIARDDGFIKNLTSFLGYSILSLDNPKIPKGGFDIFLASKEIISKINSMQGRFTFLQGDILSTGYNFQTVKYSRKKRIHGKSGYTFRKRLNNFFVAFFDSSYRPVRYLTSFGTLFAVSGFSLGAYLLYQRFQPGTPINGLSLLATLILFTSGMQMLFLSVIAQYVWRIYDLNRNKPSYVVNNITQISI